MFTFATIQDDFITDVVSSFSARGYHSYKTVSKDGDTWIGTEYVTVINNQSVAIKIAEDFDGFLAISFSVNGECDLQEDTTNRKSISRWLLAVWALLLKEYDHKTITLDVYNDDDNGDIRGKWYNKLGFVAGEYDTMVLHR